MDSVGRCLRTALAAGVAVSVVDGTGGRADFLVVASFDSAWWEYGVMKKED